METDSFPSVSSPSCPETATYEIRRFAEVIGSIPETLTPEKAKGRVIVGCRDIVDTLLIDIFRAMTDGKLVALALGGNPGGGKTRLAEVIYERFTHLLNLGINKAVRINGDFCIGHERDSNERKLVSSGDCSEMFFNEHYMRMKMFRDMLTSVLNIANSGEGGEVTLEKAYLREKGGQFGDTSLRIQPGTKLIIVDGVRSAEALRQAETPKNVVKINLFVYVEKYMSLLGATLRDMKQGKADDVMERLLMHAHQYQHIVRYTNLSAENAHYIWQRFENQEAFWNTFKGGDLVDLKEILAGLSDEAWELFSSLIPENMTPEERKIAA